MAISFILWYPCLSTYYKTSEIKELSSFANGLEKDISAVENAVSSDLSNRFVNILAWMSLMFGDKETDW